MVLFACCLLIPYALLMFYYSRLWKHVPVFTAGEHIPSEIFVSVVVAARNEANDIANCVNSLLKQDLPDHHYEVIVVDDQSTDQTSGILHRINHPCLRILAMPQGQKGGKKAALTLGIHEAKGSLILCTDADCILPSTWIRTMVSFFATYQPVFIAAPVLVQHGSSPLSIFQSLDFLSLQGITAGSVHSGFLQMSNGANLGFSKQAFLDVGGYEGIDQIASGDDMLLMQKIADRFPGRTRFCLSKEAIVKTAPVDSLSGFIRQRIRWASKGRFYTDKRMMLVLLWVYLVNFSLLILGLGCIFRSNWVLPFLLLLLSKTLCEAIFLWPVARFYKSADLMKWFPLAQPFHIIYTVVAGFFGQIRTYSWKGRDLN